MISTWWKITERVRNEALGEPAETTELQKNHIMKQAWLWHFLELFKFLNFIFICGKIHIT